MDDRAQVESSALVLFAHGARDPRWAAPFQRLQHMVQQSRPEVDVRLAFLELMQPSLPDLVAELVAKGTDRISLVPVFLGQGGHVLRDLPVMTEQLRKQYPQLQLHVVQAAGEDELVLQALRDYCLRSL
jgi:sirohydrochlorin cobaltochelatase